MKKYFEGVSNIEELKKVWKELCKKNHPDVGGCTEIMQEINNEYDILFQELKDGYNVSHQDKPFTECPAEYREVMSKIINLEGIEAELCGSWIWLSGNTYKNKEAIKEAGFGWSRNKKMWYWHPAEQKDFCYRGKKTMDSIRKTFGSEKISFRLDALLN